MSCEQAIELLGINTTGFSAADVRKRYKELYSEYQVRLSNAPTPDLKRTYQRNILDLQGACELLAPNSTDSPSADLPSPEPVTSAAEALKSSRPGLGGAHQYRRPARAGLQTPTIVLSGVAIVLAALLAFAVVRWHQTAVLLKAQQALGNPEPLQVRKPEPRERPASDPMVPILFKGAGQDCTLYVDGVKSINVSAQALTHASLPAGDHYLECAISEGVGWKKTVTFSGVGQKIVEIGNFEAGVRDVLAASIAGAVKAKIGNHGLKTYAYATPGCDQANDVQDLLAGTLVALAGTQLNGCSEVPIRLNGSKRWVDVGGLVFTDLSGQELAIK